MAAAGTVIGVGQLTIGVLQEILSALGNIDRKIAIGVGNKSGGEWHAIKTYFYSGTSDHVLPKVVPNQKAALYDARKTSGPVATGAVGVLGYTMEDGNTLGVMFSVPFDYNLYSNWWNAKVYEGSRPVDESMYHDLYDNTTFKGNNEWYYGEDIGCGYKVDGCMSSSGTCTLECYILRQ